MPTLRRSKSLNDKISRQKNRAAAGDVVRDPRSPDVEGRTRTNVDNFQALVHLRKQTEDKARQLELAFSYATNGHNTYLRPGAGAGTGGGGPLGGVELPYPPSPTKIPGGGDTSTSSSKPPVPILPRRQHSAEGRSSMVRRQESFPGSPIAASPSSASSSSSANHHHQQHQSRSREQRRGGGGQRPMSMVEPLAGGALFLPTQEELNRKDQVIQNLTEGQRSLNAHNQKLLSKVDELEFENNRLRELLNTATAAAAAAATTATSTSSPSSSSSSSAPQPFGAGQYISVTGTGPGTSSQAHHHHHHHQQHPFPGARPPNRSISFHGGDALRVSSPHAAHLPNSSNFHHHHHHHHGLASPHSETSVSGYGSLVDSPSGEGFAAGHPDSGTRTGGVGGGVEAGVGVAPPPAAKGRSGTVGGGGAGEVVMVAKEEDDDTMPLSGVSECSLECHGQDTLEKTSSSSASSAGSATSSPGSRAATLNSDQSDERDTSSGRGKKSKEKKKNGRGTARSGVPVGRQPGHPGEEDGVGEDMEEEEEEEGGPEEGGNARIEELAKQVAELSSQRDTVILRYKQLLDDSLRILKRDKRVQEELCSLVERHGSGLQGDLRLQLHCLTDQIRDPALDVEVEMQDVLSALDPCSNTGEGFLETMDPRLRTMLDKLVDLIGPDYQRLGRRLTVPQSELDVVEKKASAQPNGSKTQAMLRVWLKRRGGAGGGEEVPPAARHLVQALRDVDKDLRHCQQTIVSGPERRALRNSLQLALDHVGDPRDVLDHLIALNELSPAGIAFVQEVLEHRERAVCRLWHVSEYRATGMVSRLALALDRSHYNQLAHRLRDELEIQNSRLHTQSQPEEPPPPATPTPAPPVPPMATPTPTAPPSVALAGPSVSQARSRPASRVPRLRSKTFDSMSPPVKSPPPPAPESRAPATRRDRPPLVRPLSMTVTTRESGPAPQKERPASAVFKDRAAQATAAEERKTPASKNGGRPASQQEKRRALPVPRERSFSPFQKDKPSVPHSREKTAAHHVQQKERPFSPLAKDSDKLDLAKTEKLVIYSQRPFSPLEKDRSPRPFSPLEKDKMPRPFSPLEKDKTPRPFSPLEKDKTSRPFSPLEKDKTSRPFSPLEKDKTPRPFSPFEKDKPPRPFSPENSNKAARSGSPLERPKPSAAQQQGRSSGLPTQRERPFSPLQKDRVAASYQERAASNAQRERMNNALLHGEKRSSTPVEETPATQPLKDPQMIWDKRSAASSHFGASTATAASGARNSVILEQGGKISRV